MIPVNNPILFEDALICLKQHKKSIGQNFKGRFTQVFIGMKFFQNSLPSMHSGSFVTTEVLQTLLDDLYSKSSRPPTQSVLSLFEGAFLARTGLVGNGNTYTQNTWRNNFNLQKGIGCYAPVSDLASQTFLDQHRVKCRYISSPAPGILAKSRCTLCPSDATYRSEGHRKWLRIDPGGNGYAVTDLQNTTNFSPYVSPTGKRIPILPLIVALYHDSDPGLVLGTRANVQLADFMTDFNLAQSEFDAYFDASMAHPLNARLTQSKGWSAMSTLGVPIAPRPRSRLPKGAPLKVPVLNGTPTPPPGVNNGWEAEQFAAAALSNSGWTVHVVSRQQLGYDIFAQKGTKKRYVEVKSSLGQCSPSLTAREWQQASFHSSDYVLAVLENFNPSALNTVYWIPDPAHQCVATAQVSVSHVIPRSSWMFATTTLAKI